MRSAEGDEMDLEKDHNFWNNAHSSCSIPRVLTWCHCQHHDIRWAWYRGILWVETAAWIGWSQGSRCGHKSHIPCPGAWPSSSVNGAVGLLNPWRHWSDHPYQLAPGGHCQNGTHQICYWVHSGMNNAASLRHFHPVVRPHVGAVKRTTKDDSGASNSKTFLFRYRKLLAALPSCQMSHSTVTWFPHESTACIDLLGACMARCTSELGTNAVVESHLGSNQWMEHQDWHLVLLLIDAVSKIPSVKHTLYPSYTDEVNFLVTCIMNMQSVH